MIPLPTPTQKPGPKRNVQSCTATSASPCTSSALASPLDSWCSVTIDSRAIAPTAMMVDSTMREATQLSASVGV